MPLKHLGNCKVVALYTTEQVQTEKKLTLALFIILYLRHYTFCRAFSLAQCRSLSDTLGLSRAHFRSLSRSIGLTRALSLSLGHTRSLSRAFSVSLAQCRSLSDTLGLSRALSVSLRVRFSFVQYGASY